MVEAATIPCKEADEALKYAIISLFCLGFILGPMALVKANKARQMIALNPRLSGSGKVTAAFIIGSIGLVLWILGLIARVSNLSHQT